jgi:hypothetical protein
MHGYPGTVGRHAQKRFFTVGVSAFRRCCTAGSGILIRTDGQCPVSSFQMQRENSGAPDSDKELSCFNNLLPQAFQADPDQFPEILV